MTTIAALLDRSNHLCLVACDRYCSSDDGTLELKPHEKLGRFRRGRRQALVGVSGRWADCQWLLDQDVPVPAEDGLERALRLWWRPLVEHRIGSVPEGVLEDGALDLTALWCSHEAIVVLDGDGSVTRIWRGYHAIGSGGAAALGVLAYLDLEHHDGGGDGDLRFAVEEAVRIGTMLDVGNMPDLVEAVAVPDCPRPSRRRKLRA